VSPGGEISISPETAGTSHRTPEASRGRRAEMGPEMINEGLEVMTELAKEGIR
jgi:hypothetical protein